MIRHHDVKELTTAELERAKRELRANLGLIALDSPAHVPINAKIRAIDAELAERLDRVTPLAQAVVDMFAKAAAGHGGQPPQRQPPGQVCCLPASLTALPLARSTTRMGLP